MPTRGLPGNANLEQLKKGAKSFQRAVRAGDAGALGPEPCQCPLETHSGQDVRFTDAGQTTIAG